MNGRMSRYFIYALVVSNLITAAVYIHDKLNVNREHIVRFYLFDNEGNQISKFVIIDNKSICVRSNIDGTLTDYVCFKKGLPSVVDQVRVKCLGKNEDVLKNKIKE